MQQSPNIAMVNVTLDESQVVTTAIALKTARPTGNCQSLKQKVKISRNNMYGSNMISK
jgi:hypothetical protein